jgi:hypothetical protein
VREVDASVEVAQGGVAPGGVDRLAVLLRLVAPGGVVVLEGEPQRIEQVVAGGAARVLAVDGEVLADRLLVGDLADLDRQVLTPLAR